MGKTMAELVEEAAKAKKSLSSSDLEVGIKTAISATYSVHAQMQKMDQVSFISLSINLYRLYVNWLEKPEQKVQGTMATVGGYMQVLKGDFGALWQQMLHSEQTVKNLLGNGSICLLQGPMMIMGLLYLHYKSNLQKDLKLSIISYTSTLTNPTMQRLYVNYLSSSSVGSKLMLIKDKNGAAVPDGPPQAPQVNMSQPCVFMWTNKVHFSRAFALYRAESLQPLVKQVEDTVKNEELVDAALKSKLVSQPEALFSAQLTKVSNAVMCLFLCNMTCYTSLNLLLYFIGSSRVTWYVTDLAGPFFVCLSVHGNSSPRRRQQRRSRHPEALSSVAENAHQCSARCCQGSSP